ncbi:MAG: dephospho-CoA kinase [Oscillospiraceae bacterium]|nr:dephospho-CoA kinase [Oscillospiraceae bacterium]
MLSLPNIRVVGLTGMSGAGKSTVSGVFGEHSYDIVDCDGICREIAGREDFLREVAEKISPRLVTTEGKLDRKLTAQLIFGDAQMRERYNRLIYPYVTYEIIERIKRAERVLLDAPTLFEARLEGICTHIAAVVADSELCVKRIALRDGITEEAARARLSAQHSADFFRENCGFCIENNSSQEHLIKATKEIIKQLETQ